jgi:hydroxymethylpyrimidine pyrophosphatase-like HAD family hydrolase
MVAPLARLRERFDAVLLDLDGTLLDRASRVTPRTRRAIADLVSAGFCVVLCTGRSVTGALPVHSELGLATPFVALNGNWIGRPGEMPWRSVAILDELVHEIRRREEHADFFFRHQGNRKFTVERDHAIYRRVASWYEDVVSLADARDLPACDLMRVTCYFECEESHARGWDAIAPEARELLHRESFPLRIFPEFEDTGHVLCEVQAGGRGKAEVYAWLEQECGIPAARAIAIGDHRNDLSMLAGAGLAVVPANADESVRPLAHLVIGHHDEDGVARWFEAGAPHDAASRRGACAPAT